MKLPLLKGSKIYYNIPASIGNNQKEAGIEKDRDFSLLENASAGTSSNCLNFFPDSFLKNGG